MGGETRPCACGSSRGELLAEQAAGTADRLVDPGPFVQPATRRADDRQLTDHPGEHAPARSLVQRSAAPRRRCGPGVSRCDCRGSSSVRQCTVSAPTCAHEALALLGTQAAFGRQYRRAVRDQRELTADALAHALLDTAPLFRHPSGFDPEWLHWRGLPEELAEEQARGLRSHPLEPRRARAGLPRAPSSAASMPVPLLHRSGGVQWQGPRLLALVPTQDGQVLAAQAQIGCWPRPGRCPGRWTCGAPRLRPCRCSWPRLLVDAATSTAGTTLFAGRTGWARRPGCRWRVGNGSVSCAGCRPRRVDGEPRAPVRSADPSPATEDPT